MAGSLRWFTYTSDSGALGNVLLDESNSKAVATPGGALFASVATANPEVPTGTKLRYCNTFNTANPVQKRKFYMSTAALLGGLQQGGTILADGVTWRVTSTRGEQRRVPFLGDTGLDDGTAGNT
jgi:hypothetical protein